jgi:hypothetical protein
MARSRFCRICKEFHDLEQAWPEACVGHFGTESLGSGPQIISDTIEPFRSHADGKIYSSKSRYRADLKARGLIEVGNEKVERRPTPMRPVGPDLRRAYQQLGG